jgi:hypothetical protein
MTGGNMQVGDLAWIYTGVGESDLALGIITEIEPIKNYDGSLTCWVAFVKPNPWGVPKNNFKMSSHYIKPIDDPEFNSDKKCPCK